MAYTLYGYQLDNLSLGQAFQENGDRVDVLESDLVAPTALAAKGDPCSFGDAGTGVVVSPTATASTDTMIVQTVGVFKLSVIGQTTVSAAIAVGAAIYIDGTVLNADAANGIRFGTALAAVSSGATASIPVRLGA